MTHLDRLYREGWGRQLAVIRCLSVSACFTADVAAFRPALCKHRTSVENTCTWQSVPQPFATESTYHHMPPHMPVRVLGEPFCVCTQILPPLHLGPHVLRPMVVYRAWLNSVVHVFCLTGIAPAPTALLHRTQSPGRPLARHLVQSPLPRERTRVSEQAYPTTHSHPHYPYTQPPTLTTPHYTLPPSLPHITPTHPHYPTLHLPTLTTPHYTLPSSLPHTTPPTLTTPHYTHPPCHPYQLSYVAGGPAVWHGPETRW